MPLELSQISALHLKSLPKERSVFFFPVGPLEDHGPHLPLGLDLLDAVQFTRLIAQHLEEEMPGWAGVIMPAAPLGLEGDTAQLALTVRPYILRDWLVDICQCLIQNGFFHFVCYSGHLGPRQLTAIEDASGLVRRYAKKRRLRGFFSQFSSPLPTLVSASSALVTQKDVLRSPFWPDPVEHGGARDTSLALAIARELVQGGFEGLPKIERKSSRWRRNWMRRTRSLAGYWGDPAQGNAKLGEQEIFERLEQIFPKLKAVWEGASPRRFFRSWYSILPPNKSFYKAWLLIVCISLVLAAWGYLTLFGFQLN